MESAKGTSLVPARGLTFRKKVGEWMNTWEIAILKSFHALGGKARLQDIYREVRKFRQLTTNDSAISKWQGRPKYVHQVRKHVWNLSKAGELIWIDYGCYQLTEKGLRRIEKNLS